MDAFSRPRFPARNALIFDPKAVQSLPCQIGLHGRRIFSCPCGKHSPKDHRIARLRTDPCPVRTRAGLLMGQVWWERRQRSLDAGAASSPRGESSPYPALTQTTGTGDLWMFWKLRLIQTRGNPGRSIDPLLAGSENSVGDRILGFMRVGGRYCSLSIAHLSPFLSDRRPLVR